MRLLERFGIGTASLPFPSIGQESTQPVSPDSKCGETDDTTS